MTPFQTLTRPLRMLAIASLLLLPGFAVAQEQEPSPVPAAPIPQEAAEVIAAEQIPARASTARLTLDSVRARLPATAATSSQQLEKMAAVVDRLRRQAGFDRLESIPEFRISELQRQVEFYRRELETTESRNIARATRLSADAAELSRMRMAWTATLEASQQARLSRPLLDEARSILAQIDETEQLLERPLDDALAGRERAGRFETRLETLSRTLQDASLRAKSRRLTRDAPPIWAPGALTPMPERDWEAVQNRVNDQLQYSRDFFAAKRDPVTGYLLVGALAFVGVSWLRRRSHWFAGASGERLADASRVLERPYSSLTLILLVMALLVPELAPEIVVEALAVAIMLVLLRLMPGRLVAGRESLLVGLAALFLLDRARAMMPFDSLAFRMDQLLVSAGLAAGFAYVIGRQRRGSIPPRSWLALLVRGAPVALLLLAAAITANLLGNISLADLLIRGTLTATYVSAILFAAVYIVDDFIRMLVRSKAGQHSRMVALRGEEIARTSQRVLRLAATACWAYFTITSFQMGEAVFSRLGLALGTAISFGQLEFTLGGVMTFVVGVLIAVYSSRLVRFVLNEEVLSRVAWPPGAKSTTATLAYYGVLFAGLLLALGAAGIEVSQFTIILGALGVGIGFGLQNVVNNFVSGLILMFERPVQPEDIIDIDTLQGKVVEIGLRATRIRTWEGAEVVVPNGTLLSGNLVNWTLSDSTRRVEVPIGVAYGTNVRRVLELLMQIARSQPDAMEDPPPVVLFLGFGDSSLNFVMRFWTRDAATAVSARSEAAVAVSEAFQAEGLEIPFPQRDLHIRSVDPSAAQALK